MKIEATTKEIADLVFALQGQQKTEVEFEIDGKQFVKDTLLASRGMHEDTKD